MYNKKGRGKIMEITIIHGQNHKGRWQLLESKGLDR